MSCASFGADSEAVSGYADSYTIYRGVKDASYQLIPKVGRYAKFKEMPIDKLEKEERTMLRLFREHGRLSRTPNRQAGNYWHLLSTTDCQRGGSIGLATH
jgi:hypothetical protein